MLRSHSEIKPSKDQIIKYVSDGNLAAIKKFSYDIILTEGYEILRQAANYGQYHIAKYLIKECKVDVKPPAGKSFNETLLSLTLFNYNSAEHIENMFDLLIEAGVNIHEKSGGNYSALNNIVERVCYITGLNHRQQCLNIINKLIEKKIDIDTKTTTNGYTALIAAVEHGDDELCRILLNAGANLGVKMNSSNHTAISKAIESGHIALANELIDHAVELAKQGKCNLNEALGSSIAYVDVTNLPLLKKLIDLKADINAEDNNHRNVLDRLIFQLAYPAFLSWPESISKQEIAEFTIAILNAGIAINKKRNHVGFESTKSSSFDLAKKYEYNPETMARWRHNPEQGAKYAYNPNVAFIKNLLIYLSLNQETRKLLSHSTSTIFRKSIGTQTEEPLVQNAEQKLTI
ncbi:MAG: ankyrin repeat domain-containing protein [Gammaproteobacteria bacterium]